LQKGLVVCCCWSRSFVGVLVVACLYLGVWVGGGEGGVGKHTMVSEQKFRKQQEIDLCNPLDYFSFINISNFLQKSRLKKLKTQNPTMPCTHYQAHQH